MIVEASKREAAQVLGIGGAALQKLARQGQVARVARKGITAYVLDSEKLRKPEHRRRVLQLEQRRAQLELPVDTVNTEAWNAARQRAREIAAGRRAVLNGWDAGLASLAVTEKGAVRAALEGFLAEQRRGGRGVGRSTFYEWQRLFRSEGISGLLPRRDRRSTTIPDDAQAAFRELYLTEANRSVAHCYFLLRETYEPAGALPGLRAFQRFAKTIDKATRIRTREGWKAYRDKAAPYLERDYTTVGAGEWWVLDHHQLDVAVMGADGKPCFPWLCVVQDVRTRRWLGWSLTDAPPSTDLILAALRRALLRYGAPACVYQDNGKDYRSRMFSGGRARPSRLDVDEGRVRSLLAHLEITPHFAIPYNARAKPVERAFRTLKEWFSREWASYRGGNPSERPEHMRVLFRELKELPTLGQVDALLSEWIEKIYNEHPHAGHGMNGRSPREVYDALVVDGERRRVNPDALEQLLMRAARPVKVTRNGIRLGATGLNYRAPELETRLGQDVILRYDIAEAGRVVVWTTSDDFVCVARATERAAWGQSAELVRAAQAEERRTRKLHKASTAARREMAAEPSTIRRVTAKRAPPPAPPTPKVTRALRPRIEKDAAKAKAALARDVTPPSPARFTEDELRRLAGPDPAATRAAKREAQRQLEDMVARAYGVGGYDDE